MVLNAKFWFLAIHRYQKQPPMMTIFAVIGRGMKLVINIARNENSKILSKTCVMYLKRKLRTFSILSMQKNYVFLKKVNEKSKNAL